MPNARDSILSRREAAKRIALAQKKGQTVVFTSGCFDLLHVGHLRSLEQAQSMGDRLIVAVNRDEVVRQLKGKGRPIVPERQRAELLAGLASVDWVTFFGEETPLEIIRQLRPDVYTKGGDWSLRELYENDIPKDFPIEVRRLRQIPNLRTTKIIERTRKRN